MDKWQAATTYEAGLTSFVCEVNQYSYYPCIGIGSDELGSELEAVVNGLEHTTDSETPLPWYANRCLGELTYIRM